MFGHVCLSESGSTFERTQSLNQWATYCEVLHEFFKFGFMATSDTRKYLILNQYLDTLRYRKVASKHLARGTCLPVLIELIGTVKTAVLVATLTLHRGQQHKAFTFNTLHRIRGAIGFLNIPAHTFKFWRSSQCHFQTLFCWAILIGYL